MTAFSAWINTGANLTPYGVVFRYPDVQMEPSRAEFDQALREAEQIYAFVLSVLPAETHP